MTSVTINQKAPDFTLTDHDMNSVHLADIIGDKKIVLAFYPGAFTGVCTKEMCTLRDALKKFNGLNALVLGISVNDPFTNKAFATQNRLNFSLLCDYTREIIRRYGIVHEDFANLIGYTASKRSVFIVDEQGIVIYRWISEDPGKEPPYDKIEAALSG